MNKPDDDEPFLSRWSRMKQRAVRTDAPGDRTLPAAPADTASHAATHRDQESGETDVAQTKSAEAEAPIDLDKLPRVEELTADSDIAAFLDVRVPAALRNAALARIWTLDPTIRDFIEVAENQWNWNIPGGAPFYELIEEGSTAGLSFADATSAISRTFTPPEELAEGPPEPPAVPQDESLDAMEHQPHELIEISDQRKVDLPDENLAAAQEKSPTPDLSSVSRSDASFFALQPVDAPAPELAAAQQNHLPARRRHGGALPG